MTSALFARWLAWMSVLNLLWEIVQVPLYTLPPATIPFYTAYSVLHCTVGDVLIAGAVYTCAGGLLGWRWPFSAPLRGASLVLVLGLAYTAFSEFRNVYVLGSWGYDFAMPTVLGIGLSPLAQWLVIPPVALWRVRRAAADRTAGQ
jgi:hypothetical protein